MSIRNNIKTILLLALFIVQPQSYPQPYEREINLIPVSDPSGLIKDIFSGGHNNIEHQFVDIDGDEDLDLFYLDSDQTYGWYENVGTKFIPEYEFSQTVIPGVQFSNWYFFVDIDADGDQDYFTSEVDQISFYLNVGNASSPMFILEQDTVKDSNGDPIFSEFSCNPVFVDIDNDLDFDFISGNTAGTLRYYENIGTPQSFNFEFITDTWQDIEIIGNRPVNNPHGASSLDFVDIDGDSDYDLFWGDFFSKSLYVIENLGTPDVPDMELISEIYPINSDSVYTSGFNMPRFTDIDADGDYDLFVSVLYDPTVSKSLMFYENLGTAQAANHNLTITDFLKTLDVGNNSMPVFADIDADSDLDLFIGSLNNPLGSIHFLENIGSQSNPDFYYSDSVFFGISGDLSISPGFGDLDGDDDLDLIIGKFNGTLELYLNTGNVNSPQFLSSTPVVNDTGGVIDVGSAAIPFLFDMDNDTDLDLIVGAFNGKFYFYENIGNSTNLIFNYNDSYFLGLDVGDNSSPFILDYNEDGAYDLFSGSRDGEFFYFRNDGTNAAPVWNEITQQFISDDFGGNTYPVFVDFDNDTDLDIILGNVKGGLYLYNNTEISNVDEWEKTIVDNYSLNAFPNPFNPYTQIRLKIKEGQKTAIDIFNILGEKVKTIVNDFLPSGETNFLWQGENDAGVTLPSGIYLVVASSVSNRKAIKITFLK